MSKFQNDSIFWIEVDKIKPNPYQPRKEFSEEKLNYLADSIRQYGILQPLVVTRHEVEKPDGGLMSEYELIAGERRLRASKKAGLVQVPAIIRTAEETDGEKLELAIIENLQREDLNPIDRALAFQKLVEEFHFKHQEIAKKMGKSREYVTNSLRLLALPEEIRRALSATQITEGHARPLLMLKDRPEEQMTLFKEIIHKKLTVRDAEAIARKVAHDKVRKKEYAFDPEMAELEEQLAESLGTRVAIEKKDVGGKIMIDFFTNDDLKKILDLVHSNEKKDVSSMMDDFINSSLDIKNDNINQNIVRGDENSKAQIPNTKQNTNPKDEIQNETNFAEQNLSEEKPKIISMGEDFQNNTVAPEPSLQREPEHRDTFEKVNGQAIQEKSVEFQQQPQIQPTQIQPTQEQSQPETQSTFSSPEEKVESGQEDIDLGGGVEIIPNSNKKEEGLNPLDGQENNIINPVPDFSGDSEETKNEPEHHEDNDDLYSVKDFTI